MATLSGGSQFNIQWEEVDTSQKLEKEFHTDIERIAATHDPHAIWIRQSGEEIPMFDMDSQHVINALRMCKRNLSDPMADSEKYQFLLLEAIHRGLMDRDVGEWDTAENKL